MKDIDNETRKEKLSPKDFAEFTQDNSNLTLSLRSKTASLQQLTLRISSCDVFRNFIETVNSDYRSSSIQFSFTNTQRDSHNHFFVCSSK